MEVLVGDWDGAPGGDDRECSCSSNDGMVVLSELAVGFLVIVTLVVVGGGILTVMGWRMWKSQRERRREGERRVTCLLEEARRSEEEWQQERRRNLPPPYSVMKSPRDSLLSSPPPYTEIASHQNNCNLPSLGASPCSPSLFPATSISTPLLSNCTPISGHQTCSASRSPHGIPTNLPSPLPNSSNPLSPVGTPTNPMDASSYFSLLRDLQVQLLDGSPGATHLVHLLSTSPATLLSDLTAGVESVQVT